MRYSRCIVWLVAASLYAFSASGQQPEARGNSAEGISTTISLSNQNVLPYESVDVLVSLKNETQGTKKVVATWRVFVSIAEEKAGVPVVWRAYAPHYEPQRRPALPTAKTFLPGESKGMFAHLDFEEPTGQHVFARPGKYRVQAAASYEGFRSDEVVIVVREPEGLDAGAYKFLQKSNVQQFFSERTVFKYPRTGRNARALESFIVAFEGSEYSNHARLGLALMWMQGVDNRVDLFRAKELLTQVTQKAKEPLVARAQYYLGNLWLKRGNSVRAQEAFQTVLKGKPDPYFGFLAEQELAALKPR